LRERNCGRVCGFIGDSNLRKANKRFAVIQGGRTRAELIAPT
jgi:hypothetical protein